MDALNEKYGHPVSVRFPESELAFLDATCAKMKLTRSEVIRTGIPTLYFVSNLKAILDEFSSTMPKGDASLNTRYDFVIRSEDGV